ncbi:hypothetical protein D187_003497 [Cystobacter fuscus DSM 2262]|uniref:Uncharacterized protein n=1 Tax=Cystobacter fuscus (strain ATCC 25194 / DSM 2262 / NBRC 100088 / M29) TaxID=1242864 RepID=S9P3X5_CYSF2|nr:hypothetical protein D187_003497 [Cystobacter fuscus DSM 2262]
MLKPFWGNQFCADSLQGNSVPPAFPFLFLLNAYDDCAAF